MVQWVVAVAAALMASLLLPLAAGQDAEAPHPSPDVKTLYAHAATQDDNTAGWMNTLTDDGEATMMGVPPNACAAPSGLDTVTCLIDGDEGDMEDDVTFTLELDPALTRDLIFNADNATIEATAYLGGPDFDGEVSASMSLSSADNTTIAEGAAQDVAFDASFQAVTWSLTSNATNVSAADGLTWTITVTGTYKELYLGMSADTGRSNLVLPIGALGPGPEPETLQTSFNETVALISFSGAGNGTNTGFPLEWEFDATAVDVNYTADVTNGSVEFNLTDGNGTVLLEGNVTSTATVEDNFTDTANGTWRVQFELKDFVGTFTITITAMDGDGGPGDGNMTGDGNETDDDGLLGIPGPGPLVVVGALALAAAAWRRRP